MAISASYLPVAASFFAARGNSNAPGTCTTSTFLLAAPARSRASTAPARSRSVIKLLKRLTTMPKRKPAALSAPSIFPGCIFSAIVNRADPYFCPLLPLPHLLPLLPLELRRPLLQKCLRAFAHVFRRASHSEKRRLQEQPFLLRHFHAAFDRFHGEFHGQRPVGDNLLRHRFRGRNQLCRLVDMIDQAEEREFLAVDRCLQRQLADIRACDERFFSRARKDQYAHGLVLARVEQRMLQLFHRLAV